MTPDILPILRCPAGDGQLALADQALIDQINEQIAAGQARDQLDQPVPTPIDGGLLPATGDRLYPIRNHIPTLIADEAIRL